MQETVTINDNGTRTVHHGGYGMRTHFDIAQHRYACTDCEAPVQSYQELLEIKDAPPGRTAFLIHLFRHDIGARVWEFPTMADAQAGWMALSEIDWSSFAREQYLPLLPTSTHVDFPGMKLPWFYETA